MFNLTLPVRAKIIVAQAVELWTDDRFQPGFQLGPLCRIDLNLKHRILHPLAKIEASPSDTAQSSASGAVFCLHIIGNQNEHRTTFLFPYKARIAIHVPAQMTR